LTSFISTKIRRDKVTIAGFRFKISTEAIDIGTGIPNSGENGLRA